MTRQQFRSVLEELLGVDPGSLADSDTRDTVEAWSSLVDVQILSTIHSDLGIEADETLLEKESAGELLDALSARHAFST